jgi:hypothetical protein
MDLPLDLPLDLPSPSVVTVAVAYTDDFFSSSKASEKSDK